MSDNVIFDPATLKFDDAGLVPAIAQDIETGKVLICLLYTSDAADE